MKQFRPFSMLGLWVAAAMMLATAHAQQSPIAMPVLFDINTTSGGWSYGNGGMASLGNLFLIPANNGVNGPGLYAIDASAATPAPVRLQSYLALGGLRNINGTVYLSAMPSSSIGAELYKTNGTTAGTFLVRDLLVSTKEPSSRPQDFHAFVNGKTVFTAAYNCYQLKNWQGHYDAINGWFVTDGSSSGTTCVSTGKSFTTGTSSSPIATTVHNGLVYGFMKDFAKTGSPPTSKYGLELWKSDGTLAGTSMVKDIYVGTASGCVEAYKSDYVPDRGIKALANRIVPLGDYVYFLANDGSTGYELWKSNGTSAGTTRVLDIYSGAQSGWPAWMTVMNNKLYFAARNGSDGDKLMRYDPLNHQLGAQLVADINGTSSDSAWVRWLTVVGDKLFFSAYTAENGHELWSSDGIPTSQGGSTQRVADINPGSGSSYPNVSWYDPMTGGQTILEQDQPEATSSRLHFFAHNGWIYFPANDGTHGIELWRSNGTTTQLLTDINTDPNFNNGSSDIPFTMSVVNNKLFFIGYNASAGWEPYMIDLATLPKSGSRAPMSPLALSLDQNYPNPFNPTTSITFTVPESGPVSVRVYDALGREVALLAEGALDAGVYQRTFDARTLPSGAYICRLEQGGHSLTRIMHLVK